MNEGLMEVKTAMTLRGSAMAKAVVTLKRPLPASMSLLVGNSNLAVKNSAPSANGTATKNELPPSHQSP